MKQKIKQELKQLADEKYREFHTGLCPGTENILGIRVPVLRNYAKKLSKEYEIRDLLNDIDNEYYEEIMLQGMLIGLEKETNKEIQNLLQDIERFVPKIDNWAICDVFCAGLKITKKHEKEMWDFLQKYVISDKEFEIRFGVVMILDYYITEKYLEKNLFSDKLSVKNIAQESNISEVYFRKMFKEKYGKSPLSYINDMRIKKAKELIINEENLSIKEVSDACGFLDIYSFSRSFKKNVGVSPSQYRKKMQFRNC